MDSRSLSRELSLISLGLINDSESKGDTDLKNISLDMVLESAIDFMANYCREELNQCENLLNITSNNFFELELSELDNFSSKKTREDLQQSLSSIEKVMNILSDALDFPKLIAITNQESLRNDINSRVLKVIQNSVQISKDIDEVMDGWRFKRLPRIDRDILRLAYVDINFLNVPISVACNEAVNLANKYSDTQGRKMINGILRRLQKVKIK
tara:strand:- start:189 stop:824 length:636 start_codon:yes stop_codon:yes gene_type:complete